MTRLFIPLLALGALGCGDGQNRRPGEPFSYDEAVALARRGQSVVRAAHQFHHRTGLWPTDLDELAGDGVTKDAAAEWRHVNWHNADWSMVYAGPFRGGTLRYTHPTGWEVRWGDAETTDRGAVRLDVGPSPDPGPQLPAAEIQNNLIATIRDRVEREPGHLIHHKGLISHLLKLGRVNEADEACRRCRDRWPDHWWPNLMGGLIAIRRGDPDPAAVRLKEWADRHGDFHHHYFVAHFYATAGRDADAREALRRAVKTSVDKGWDRHGYKETAETSVFGDETYIRDAALIAYRTGDRDLCLAVCDRWEEFITARGYGGSGYAVLRAACDLNRGEYEAAARHVETALAGQGYRCSRGEHVTCLQKAIAEKRAGYRYDPRETKDLEEGSPIELLVDYR